MKEPAARDTQRPRRGRKLSLSVRTRIITVITIVTAIGLLAVGVSVYLVERHRILEQVDVRLEANLDSARYIVAEGSQDTGTWASSTQALTSVVERMSPDDNTGAIGMADGVITTVPGMQLDLELSSESEFAAYVHETAGTDGPMLGTYVENGVVWRYLAAPIAVEGSPDPAVVTFVMVYDLEAEFAEFDAAARMFVLVSAIVLLVVAATGTIVATRLLRPLRDMRETAERVSERSLEERLPIVGNDDVAELAETINQMLDRLDDAMGSQRQLLSDVGHELKTPITIVRGQLEVMDAADPDDTRATRDLVIDELDRMARLVQDLSDAAALHGPRPVLLQPVDVADFMRQMWQKATGVAGAEVRLARVAEGVAVLDPERIAQAVLQLVQNGATHGGGQVDIESAIEGSALFIGVRDYGAGIADSARERIFDRFVRGSQAAPGSGNGLGLAIVRVIARAHGGEVSVQNATGGGARFVIEVPLQVAYDRGK